MNFPQNSARRAFKATVLVASLAIAPLMSAAAQAEPAYAAAYDRLLPLEGGSNFRDMGGYFSADGKQVKRGLLFRSGVMTSLTPADQAYLAQFDFKSVIDLRSSDERELYPNKWANAADIKLLSRNYNMRDMMKDMVDEQGQPRGMDALYRGMPEALEPQMRMLFEEALAGRVPLVVNCSAGQDRTGISSAMLLLALGVPRDVVFQDYLMSTRYRRPQVEAGDVDLKEAAKTNEFAAMMLSYTGGEKPAGAKPLLTDEGIPYLHFALAQVEAEYGTIEAYLDKALGIDEQDLQALREQYLEATYLSP